MKIIFILCILLIAFLSQIERIKPKENITNKALLDLYQVQYNNTSDDVQKIIMHYFNGSIEYDKLKPHINEECNNKLNNINNNLSLLSTNLGMSGKYFNDIGLEVDCKAFNYSYILIQFFGNMSELYGNTEIFYFYNFLTQTDNYVGLCLPRECNKLYEMFFDIKINSKFFESLNETQKIYKVKPYFRFDGKETFLGKFITVFLIVYMFLRIVVSLLGHMYFKSEEYQSENSNDNAHSSSSINSDENELNGDMSMANIFQKKSSDKKPKRETFSASKYIFYIFYKLMNFRAHLKYLIIRKNKYYDDTDLDYINYLRAFSFFFIIFKNNTIALINTPHREFANYKFFTNWWFWTVKISFFFNETWIFLDGFVLAFKLMNHLKKSNDYSLKSFLRFYGIVFTKFLIFLIIYIFLYIRFKDIRYLFQHTPFIEYYMDNINSDYDCFENSSFKIMLPFNYEYQRFYLGNKEYRLCYRFSEFYSNEFFCFTFMIIIFYIGFKLKSKIFDICFALFILINMTLSFLPYHKFSNNFSFQWILGNNYSVKYTYLFINPYVIGIFIGLNYFYYKDIITSSPLSLNRDYIPFRFCFDIMKIIDTSNIYLINFIFYFCIFILFFLSNTTYLYILYGRSKNNLDIRHINPEIDFNLEVNPMIEFLFIYEKIIFIIFYAITILVSLFPHRITKTSKLFFESSFIFLPFSKVNLASFSILEGTSYLLYSVYESQLNLTNLILLIMSIVLFILIWFISILLHILFDVPLRFIYKQLIRSDNKKNLALGGSINL